MRSNKPASWCFRSCCKSPGRRKIRSRSRSCRPNRLSFRQAAAFTGTVSLLLLAPRHPDWPQAIGINRNGASACRPPITTPDLRAAKARREHAGSAMMRRIAGIFASLHHPARRGPIPPPLPRKDSLTVFAAASMKKRASTRSTPPTPQKTGVKITVSYAASSALAKQIEQGAPADVFVSADTDWMDYAISKKTINEPTRVNLLGNSIVLIAPNDSKVDKRQYRTRPRSRQTGRRRQDRDRGRESSPGRANTPRRRWRNLAHGRRPSRNSRWPTACAAALTLVARGEATLGIVYSNRRQGRTRRQDRWDLPGRFPSGDHLSGRGDDDRKTGNH